MFYLISHHYDVSFVLYAYLPFVVYILPVLAFSHMFRIISQLVNWLLIYMYF